MVDQNGTSMKPFVVLASSWFDSWYPSDGTWGLVPYGTSGLVSALAMGARAIAPPIAAAASHGAMYLFFHFVYLPVGLFPLLRSAGVSLIVRRPRSRG